MPVGTANSDGIASSQRLLPSDPSNLSLHKPMSVELVGPYHADSYGGGGNNTAAVGWQGLRIGAIAPGRAAPFRIDRNGTPIGWAPGSSLRLKGIREITVGITVIVASG
jgi:hypothetical protein